MVVRGLLTTHNPTTTPDSSRWCRRFDRGVVYGTAAARITTGRSSFYDGMSVSACKTQSWTPMQYGPPMSGSLGASRARHAQGPVNPDASQASVGRVSQPAVVQTPPTDRPVIRELFTSPKS